MRLILGQLLVGLICSGTTKKLRWCLEPDYMCPYIHGKPSIEFTFFLSTAHSLQTHSLLSLFQHIKRKPSVIDCRWNGLGYFPWIECINFHFATNVTLLGSSSSRPIPSRTPDLQRKKNNISMGKNPHFSDNYLLLSTIFNCYLLLLYMNTIHGILMLAVS